MWNSQQSQVPHYNSQAHQRAQPGQYSSQAYPYNTNYHQAYNDYTSSSTPQASHPPRQPAYDPQHRQTAYDQQHRQTAYDQQHRQPAYDQKPGHGGGVYEHPPQRESNERVQHHYETAKTTQAEPDDRKTVNREEALSPVPKISMITRICDEINPIRIKYETQAYHQLTDNEKDNTEITKHRKVYTELLTQKLVGLDSVDAEGLESVRQARKEAVVKLESMLSQLDTFVKRETELRELLKSSPVEYASY